MGSVQPHSFFKVMIGPFRKTLFIPPQSARSLRSLVNQNFYLEDSNGRSWTVELSVVEKSLAFQKGWNKFIVDHGIEFGEFLVFKYKKSLHFSVQIFGIRASERSDFPYIINNNGHKRKRDNADSSHEHPHLHKHRRRCDHSKQHCKNTNLDSSHRKKASGPDEISHSKVAGDRRTKTVCASNITKTPSNLVVEDPVSEKIRSSSIPNSCTDAMRDKNPSVQNENCQRCNGASMKKLKKNSTDLPEPRAKRDFRKQDKQKSRPTDFRRTKKIGGGNSEEREKVAVGQEQAHFGDGYFDQWNELTLLCTEHEVRKAFIASTYIYKFLLNEEGICFLVKDDQIVVGVVSTDDSTSDSMNEEPRLQQNHHDSTGELNSVLLLVDSSTGNDTPLASIKKELYALTIKDALHSSSKISKCHEITNAVGRPSTTERDEVSKETEKQLVPCSNENVGAVVKLETTEANVRVLSSANPVEISFLVTSSTSAWQVLPTNLPMKRGMLDRKVALLQDSSMRVWPVLYLCNEIGFRGGWLAFATANKVQDGDVCVLEMVDELTWMFQVQIIRK